ncbi:cap-specific mRNA (nucleoside-2'-O-)-methyltransferase 2 [Rhinatrema bivittatum]|uniref:cap-specific mRNA (nucleoside-2'-O-)-methyltransferase 2 n=1 Tax=Rhinatrema bivittatum TaxID=194408 RepID=UPI001127CE1B|nr:cap-specific mRNA (nucleoside-2'-O-)-methyltransferase 2 [Rhinatrema bivittatum]XP_029468797.1 cap-specific mRNA (nucleoside-2'-O-)-methyltransferase 2 [Rhinatrema bivittatum]XP_029468798.1 cap-specific mRNA (nucleoside-2'-O-)-methyltransferase 2 [Rhinatrema bivittatum]
MNKCKRPHVEQTTSMEVFSPDVLAEVSSLFEKKFSYRKPQHQLWQLPESTDAFTTDHKEFDALLDLKESLNKTKNLLSDKKLDEWHRHTSFTNKAGKVIPEVKRTVNAELCTQAWCKFHEIVCCFPLLPKEALWNRELNSVHLCEAPGAFIASLNHYLKSQHAPHLDWNWVANTLNPYHEANDTLFMIMDDRFIANTLSWWYFGPENTGDIMTLKYLTGLQQFISPMTSVHLVTADGSFDCQWNPGEQEALVAPLHYCETITALMILGKGGSFVLKMFTLYEHSSVNLLFLLNCCFKDVHVFKPGTSKSGNSEVYVVCLEYAGRDAVHSVLAKMVQNFGSEITDKALFPHHAIPKSFLRVHKQCCSFFHKHQIETIKDNLRLFEHMTEDDRTRLNTLRDYAVAYFLQKLDMKYICRKDWLVKKCHAGCSMNAQWFGNRNKRSDTYNERKYMETLSWEDKVMKGYFTPWAEEHVLGNMRKGCILEGLSHHLECDEWYILEGKKLPEVKCSLFCDGELLKNLNEAIENSSVSRPKTGPSPDSVQQPCHSCHVLTDDLILSELLNLAKCHQTVKTDTCKNQVKCLVVGSPSLYRLISQTNMEVTLLQSTTPCAFRYSLLHDGEPRYQQQFLNWILHSLAQLQSGDALVLPIMSCFTRFTAGLLFVLHHCFRFITFACPTSSRPLGNNAVLLCSGYRCPPSPVCEYLHNTEKLMSSLLDSESPQQILAFVPVETLLKGKLTEFLWDLNSAIMKQRLHLIGQIEQLQTRDQSLF